MTPHEIQIERLKLLWAKRRLQVIDSFHEFVKDAFEVLHNEQPLDDNWHIKYICDRLQAHIERVARRDDKTQDLIINVPPRTLKSIITSVCLPAWTWISHPWINFISSSYASDLSIDHNVMCRRVIESAWYQKQFRDKFQLTTDQNTKGYFENDKSGRRKATSTGGSVTGSGAHVIIEDDPINPKKAASETERKNANDYHDLTLSTRFNDQRKGLHIIVMQRLHEDDPTGHALKQNPGRWEHICLPASLSSNIKPFYLAANYKQGLLFPQRLPKYTLDNLRATTGSFGYSGQYIQSPTPLEGGIWKRKWFRKITWFQFLEYLNGKVPTWNFFVDTAYTAKTENDPTAILACCFSNNTLFIRKVEKGYFEFPNLIKFIPDFVRLNGYTQHSRIYVEPKASGISTVQQLRAITLLNIIQSPPPTDDKITRANSASPFVESGRVCLIEDDWNEEYLDEVCTFPKADHDDQMDITVMAIDKVINKGKGDLKATVR